MATRPYNLRRRFNKPYARPTSNSPIHQLHTPTTTKIRPLFQGIVFYLPYFP